MLLNVSLEAFSKVISDSYSIMKEIDTKNVAKQLMESIDGEIEPAVIAWVNGDEIPDIHIGQYSINKILAIGTDLDYLEVFLLLTEYKNDPVLGKKKIWTPKRLRKHWRE